VGYGGRLLDREHDGAGDRFWRQRELVSGAFELRFHRRICHAFRKIPHRARLKLFSRCLIFIIYPKF
jgi:hypothetical protein